MCKYEKKQEILHGYAFKGVLYYYIILIQIIHTQLVDLFRGIWKCSIGSIIFRSRMEAINQVRICICIWKLSKNIACCRSWKVKMRWQERTGQMWVHFKMCLCSKIAGNEFGQKKLKSDNKMSEYFRITLRYCKYGGRNTISTDLISANLHFDL